ncbi:MAG TPA: T9SS type A sorting domain-containing protein [bacterium]|nr:T9SS type A sorting domain-containing protein [bacterium]HPR87758.1 T9SS type A sorting domain-containing protein [bacterium]
MAKKWKILHLLIFSAATLGYGWGGTGHRIVNGSAALSFPPEMAFLGSWSNGLAEHGSDADSRKSSDPAEENKHYIDIDAFPEFLAAGRIVQDFDSLAALHGREFLMEQGILPWAIIAATDALTQALQSRQWDRALLLAADLGHYIGDAHNPLHITRNYNGQYSTQQGVHSRYESKMLDRYASAVTCRGNRGVYITHIADYTFRMIYSNYACVDSVLLADRSAALRAGNTWNDAYYTSLWQDAQSFTVPLLDSAASRLASLIYTCWINAGSPRPTSLALTHPAAVPGYSLGPNYPNPFNPATTLTFTLAAAGRVRIEILNLLGQEVALLRDEWQTQGYHEVTWHPQGLPGGVYICRIRAGAFQATRAMQLIP